jgi:hypothetical protein
MTQISLFSLKKLVLRRTAFSAAIAPAADPPFVRSDEVHCHRDL